MIRPEAIPSQTQFKMATDSLVLSAELEIDQIHVEEDAL